MRPLAAEAIARALNTNYVLQRLSLAWNGAGLPPTLPSGYWACLPTCVPNLIVRRYHLRQTLRAVCVLARGGWEGGRVPEYSQRAGGRRRICCWCTQE